jgi:hypothetical protein
MQLQACGFQQSFPKYALEKSAYFALFFNKFWLENWIPTCRTLPVSHLVQASIQN